MKTPTKEQIEIMFKNMSCEWFGWLPEDRKIRIDFTKVINDEWEKIRGNEK